MGLQMGTVKLEEYNPKWKAMFEDEKANLKEIFKDFDSFSTKFFPFFCYTCE